MSFKRILLVGDSFCKHRNEVTDWPQLLRKLLKCQVLGQGWSGNAWWTVRQELNSFDIDRHSTLLIVIHTSPARLPNDFKIPINSGLLKAEPGTIHSEPISLDEYTVARNFYNSKLFSPGFYEWASRAWIKELDDNQDFYAIIHIPAFDDVDLSNVKNGFILQPSTEIKSLRALSNMEIIEENWGGPDSRRNHFNKHNNVKMAEVVTNAIKKMETAQDKKLYFDNLDQWDFTKTHFIPRKL